MQTTFYFCSGRLAVVWPYLHFSVGWSKFKWLSAYLFFLFFIFFTANVKEIPWSHSGQIYEQYPTTVAINFIS